MLWIDILNSNILLKISKNISFRVAKHFSTSSFSSLYAALKRRLTRCWKSRQHRHFDGALLGMKGSSEKTNRIAVVVIPLADGPEKERIVAIPEARPQMALAKLRQKL